MSARDAACLPCQHISGGGQDVDFEAPGHIDDGETDAAARAPERAPTPSSPATQDPISRFAAQLDRHDASAVLDAAIHSIFPGRIALTSSFGADSVVLLHITAQISPATPVLFLDTGKLFAETIAYRDLLVECLGLRDVRSVSPHEARIAEEDPSGYLWTVEPDQCCTVRKVEPLAPALADFDAWVTGRKRFQGVTRTELPMFERDHGSQDQPPRSVVGGRHIQLYGKTQFAAPPVGCPRLYIDRLCGLHQPDQAR